MEEFNIPIFSNDDLITTKAIDTYPELVAKYNETYRLVNGKTISDIAFVYEDLKDWTDIEKADLMIPYTFAKQRQEPRGHRIWYLSQYDRLSRYYNGCLFDIQSTDTKERIIRRRCKLSDAAIEFFEKHPEIKLNKGIDDER